MRAFGRSPWKPQAEGLDARDDSNDTDDYGDSGDRVQVKDEYGVTTASTPVRRSERERRQSAAAPMAISSDSNLKLSTTDKERDQQGSPRPTLSVLWTKTPEMLLADMRELLLDGHVDAAIDLVVNESLWVRSMQYVTQHPRNDLEFKHFK